jgi:general secretion pathway protein C
VIDLPAPVSITAKARLEGDLRRWLLPLWSRLAAVPAVRWRQLVLVLCAAWVLANLARFVWLLLPAAAPAQAAGAPVNPLTPPARTAIAVDIDRLVGWHLFGEAGASPATPAAAGDIAAQAQDTALNLQLVGLVQSSDDKLARAILLLDGRQQQFAIGEQLPASGKVVLARVLADRAILDNNGRYETLWLYDPAAAQKLGQPSTPVPAATSDLRGNGEVTAAVTDYRAQLYQNPASLANLIQVSVQQDGFRIRPGSDPQTFAALGLLADDVVTAINGTPVNDPQQALEVYNQMRTATEANLTIRRGGEDIVIHVSLQNPATAD